MARVWGKKVNCGWAGLGQMPALITGTERGEGGHSPKENGSVVSESRIGCQAGKKNRCPFLGPL